ncbi:DUF2262 domain-containing protein [Zavarzinella formosa]|uniref:DUF2262 domain-containing protein n=1 Tax=Zavarzinella formosa TaxID=360055 RepID=UPI0003006F9D|nr:DUF2262 domain-containing protein [Zavarzinella formosa]
MSESIDDPLLGRLTWDHSQNLWTGQAMLRTGRRVKLVLDPTDKPLDRALLLAGQGLAWVQGNEEQARLAVADDYLAVFNREWTEEGPITREEFARRIELIEIGFGPDGAPNLWYDDGDLFAGHSISAYFDANGRFRNASLFG